MALELLRSKTGRAHPLQKLSRRVLQKKYGHLFTPEAIKEMHPLLQETVASVHGEGGHDLRSLRGKPLPGLRERDAVSAPVLYAMAIASARRALLPEQTAERHAAILDEGRGMIFTKAELEYLDSLAARPRATAQKIADTKGRERGKRAVDSVSQNISRKLKTMGLQVGKAALSRQPIVQLVEKHALRLTPAERAVLEQYLRLGKTASQTLKCLPNANSLRTVQDHANHIYEKLEWALLRVNVDKRTGAERDYLESRRENREARRPRK